ncbi:MAG: hypothetical protein KGH94_03310 [Candidatus Micrarchaeota archaeon]|nr:hypothetical protein [Candidatus Micrarchaeota archaeon]
MQAESGQELGTIILHKELERELGSGRFYWGIGNALGPSLPVLVNKTKHPEILFSIMKSRPKTIDSNPNAVSLWSEYIDESGHPRPLPEYVLILSRAITKSGMKKRSYALVCHSDITISLSHGTHIDISHLRNLSGQGRKVGFSQVTAIVEHTSSVDRGISYEINLRALLKPPYLIKLAHPVRLSGNDLELIKATANNSTATEWLKLVKEIKSRCGVL